MLRKNAWRRGSSVWRARQLTLQPDGSQGPNKLPRRERRSALHGARPCTPRARPRSRSMLPFRRRRGVRAETSAPLARRTRFRRNACARPSRGPARESTLPTMRPQRTTTLSLQFWLPQPLLRKPGLPLSQRSMPVRSPAVVTAPPLETATTAPVSCSWTRPRAARGSEKRRTTSLGIPRARRLWSPLTHRVIPCKLLEATVFRHYFVRGKTPTDHRGWSSWPRVRTWEKPLTWIS